MTLKSPLIHLSDQNRFPPESSTSLRGLGVFSGAFLAFYAFIGFEDMVNMAEEVKNVRRSLPIAILVSIALTTVLYVAVASAAVLSGSTERLAESPTPIAELASGQGWMSTTGVWLVSLFWLA